MIEADGNLTRRAVLGAAAATAIAAGAPVEARAAPRLRVAANGRHLERADGRPFFWLADTAWELFHRLTLAEAKAYLDNRRRKGFNVIQAVALAEIDGLRAPNANGDLPLFDLDPTRLNPAYFAHVDRVIDAAAARGLTVALLPTWGDKFNLKWGVGPEIFTPANAHTFAALLARRYRDRPVVWVLGGDRNPETPLHFAIVRGMAQGIRAVVGQRQLITYHPQGESRSWDAFRNEPWIDFHLFQSGHARRDFANDGFTAAGRALSPPRPVIDGEPRYEDLPIGFKPENGRFDAFDVRQAAWWSVLAGAAGHSYGNHNIWQMWQPGRGAITAADTPWREAMDHPGAAQMGHVRSLMERVGFAHLVPASERLATPGTGGARQMAARNTQSGTLIAYTPYGEDIILTGMQGKPPARFQWFDPRTGKLSHMQKAADNSGRFHTTGGTGRGRDWALVVHGR